MSKLHPEWIKWFENNFTLAKAAPDLLIVAKEAVHHDEGGPGSNERVQRAIAAIAKAEGK